MLSEQQDELCSKLASVGLRLERIGFEGHDVLVDVSLDADSPDEADTRAHAAARFLPAWRVVLTRIDPPQDGWSSIGREQHRAVSAAVAPLGTQST